MKRFLNSFFKYIFEIWKKSNEHRIGAYAAQASFFVVLSLIPSMMFIISMVNHIIPYFLSQSELDMIIRISAFLPDSISAGFEGAVWDIMEKSAGISIVTAITALWFASRGFAALNEGISNVLSDGEQYNYFVRRFLSVVYMFIFTLLMIFTAVLLLFGKKLTAVLSPLMPGAMEIVIKLLHLRWAIVFVILAFFFTLFYKFMPKHHHKIKDLIPGAMLASGGWLIFTCIFRVYVTISKSYDSIYGSISYLILGMLWLYFCMEIMLLGAEINYKLIGRKKRLVDNSQ